MLNVTTSGYDARAVITETLLGFGWLACPGPAIAVKSFETAVGLKTADAW